MAKLIKRGDDARKALESGVNQLADTAAEDCLFTEEVRFRFFLEGRLDDAGTRTADATGISQGEVEAFSGSILFNSEYVGDAAAFYECTADEMARALRSDHEDVDISRRNDLFEVNVEAVCKSEGTAGFQVRSDFRCIYVSLFFVRNQDHRDICVFYSFRNGFNFKAGFFGFSDGFAAFIQADDDVDAAVFEVQRMGMALAAITDDCDFFAFHYIPVYILIIKYFCHDNISPLE